MIAEVKLLVDTAELEMARFILTPGVPHNRRFSLRHEQIYPPSPARLTARDFQGFFVFGTVALSSPLTAVLVVINARFRGCSCGAVFWSCFKRESCLLIWFHELNLNHGRTAAAVVAAVVYAL